MKALRVWTNCPKYMTCMHCLMSEGGSFPISQTKTLDGNTFQWNEIISFEEHAMQCGTYQRDKCVAFYFSPMRLNLQELSLNFSLLILFSQRVIRACCMTWGRITLLYYKTPFILEKRQCMEILQHCMHIV